VIDYSEISKGIGSLPTLPTVVARIAQLATDERTTAAEFERALTPDPALTANLLRLANSAHFGCTRRVTSVRQAVMLLGTRRLFELATSASFACIIPERLPGYDIEARSFWMHSVAVGVFCERLGARVGRSAPDLAFTAGLLHDIGKLVIGTYVAKDVGTLTSKVNEGGVSFIAAESEVLGADHARVGAEIAERWNLPLSIGVVARWHHDPMAAPSDHLLVALTHAADGLAHSLGFGADVGQLARRVQQEAVKMLGLKPESLEEVASASVSEIEEIGKLLVDAKG
jgi:putative nucleotidyltransferase with HDIG domain